MALPPLSVVVRPAVRADLAAITAALPPPHPLTFERRLAVQEAGDGLWFVAWLAGVPVGMVLLRFHGPDDAESAAHAPPGTPHLEAAAVRTDLQSRGIGTALLAAAERAAAARGATSIGLAVGVANVRARALYARRGYRETGTGEFSTTWPYLDDDGVERTGGERCTYQVKRLAPGDG